VIISNVHKKTFREECDGLLRIWDYPGKEYAMNYAFLDDL